MSSPLSITLDHPGLPYRPGDTLMGHVEVSPALEFQFIEVSLIGGATNITVSGRHRIVHQYSATLVHRIQDFKLNSSAVYRFEMAIPSTTEDVPNPFVPDQSTKRRFFYTPPTHFDARKCIAEAKDHKALDGFAQQPGHALPPTMPLASSGTGFSSSHFSTVEYSVVAQVMRRESSNKCEVIATGLVPFWITTNCPSSNIIRELVGSKEQTQQSRNFLVSSKTLLTEEELGKYSILDRAKMKMSGSSTPAFSFKTTAYVPSYAHIGEAFKFQVDFDPEGNSSTKTPTVTKVPDLEVTGGTVRLERMISSYAREVAQSVTTVSEAKLAQPASPPKLSGSNLGYKTSNFELGPDFLNRGIIPDFRTYNIYVAYRIKATLDIICANQKMVYNFAAPVKLFSRPRQALDVGETSGFVEGPQDVTEDWGPCRARLVGKDRNDLLSAVDGLAAAAAVANLALAITSLVLVS